MTTALPYTGADAVEFLIGQHMQIRDLFTEVRMSPPAQRAEVFGRLVRLLLAHETAEEEVLRPMTRARIDGGMDIADARIDEEEAAREVLAELQNVDPATEAFLDALEELRLLVLEHAHNEEAYEFRYLRQKMGSDEGTDVATMLRTAQGIAG